MTNQSHATGLDGPAIMLVSALIFGYFGFGIAYPEIDPRTGNTIPLVLALKWTIRGSAIAFLLSGIVTLAQRVTGNFLYAILSLVSSCLLVVVAAWDALSPYYSGVSIFLLLLFAGFNGYGAWRSLQVLLSLRRIVEPLDGSFPARSEELNR